MKGINHITKAQGPNGTSDLLLENIIKIVLGLSVTVKTVSDQNVYIICSFSFFQ